MKEYKLELLAVSHSAVWLLAGVFHAQTDTPWDKRNFSHASQFYKLETTMPVLDIMHNPLHGEFNSKLRLRPTNNLVC